MAPPWPTRCATRAATAPPTSGCESEMRLADITLGRARSHFNLRHHVSVVGVTSHIHAMAWRRRGRCCCTSCTGPYQGLRDKCCWCRGMVNEEGGGREVLAVRIDVHPGCLAIKPSCSAWQGFQVGKFALAARSEWVSLPRGVWSSRVRRTREGAWGRVRRQRCPTKRLFGLKDGPMRSERGALCGGAIGIMYLLGVGLSGCFGMELVKRSPCKGVWSMVMCMLSLCCAAPAYKATNFSHDETLQLAELVKELPDDVKGIQLWGKHGDDHGEVRTFECAEIRHAMRLDKVYMADSTDRHLLLNNLPSTYSTLLSNVTTASKGMHGLNRGLTTGVI
ncbi:hypothetical protein HaLaN_27731 [Haematococcus lacustris]|uniref:Uncharacterized protein n=1 Tax=Haematococcus lacustris TaxID=44745 RepID=A0A6A0A9N6_HAELA|nr:hypothetical protein HaLaN_27731 [Haematococcus lacustris]